MFNKGKQFLICNIYISSALGAEVGKCIKLSDLHQFCGYWHYGISLVLQKASMSSFYRGQWTSRTGSTGLLEPCVGSQMSWFVSLAQHKATEAKLFPDPIAQMSDERGSTGLCLLIFRRASPGGEWQTWGRNYKTQCSNCKCVSYKLTILHYK